MRKIDIKMGKEFMKAISGQNLKNEKRCGNTTVRSSGTGEVNMFLHGNLISKSNLGIIEVSFAGYPTQTTRARLNGVLQQSGVPGHFAQIKGLQYYISGDNKTAIDPKKWYVLAKNGVTGDTLTD